MLLTPRLPCVSLSSYRCDASSHATVCYHITEQLITCVIWSSDHASLASSLLTGVHEARTSPPGGTLHAVVPDRWVSLDVSSQGGLEVGWGADGVWVSAKIGHFDNLSDLPLHLRGCCWIEPDSVLPMFGRTACIGSGSSVARLTSSVVLIVINSINNIN